ncbi:MAG: isoaspartyl peptidase/L-asparaginase [Bacteroidota bacterium]|nr:isoaspartyl peptidase/L-asparaginase [Bacteroidota bacterium]
MLSFIVHGGAWDIPNELIESHKNGVSKALQIGWDILRNGGSAIDAVENAVNYLENDTTFDAGRGSHLNAEGNIELDASIMNGKTFRCGSVGAVKNVRNPISLCRKIMDESEHIFLVGTGAEKFAKEHGIALCSSDDLLIEREVLKWKSIQGKKDFSTKDAFKFHTASDTVGAVAMDSEGIICAGTSTGGTFNKHPGRVGDSPLIGCGTYADNSVGGVSTTGWGEAMIKVVMAKTVIDLMEFNAGDPQEAAEKGIEILAHKADGYGGLIALNTKGEFGIAFNTPRMARAFINSHTNTPQILII